MVIQIDKHFNFNLFDKIYLCWKNFQKFYIQKNLSIIDNNFINKYSFSFCGSYYLKHIYITIL